MQADYFRLCYLRVEGGIYIDADDVCTASDISWLIQDARLKLQPLCYDTSTNSMVEPAMFLHSDIDRLNWIFYFNNNPLIAGANHPVITRALEQATSLLESSDNELPEIQSATGPGNLSRAVYELGTLDGSDIARDVFVMKEWNAIATTQWPLSYRNDERNWRLSNQKRFP